MGWLVCLAITVMMSFLPLSTLKTSCDSSLFPAMLLPSKALEPDTEEKEKGLVTTVVSFILKDS